MKPMFGVVVQPGTTRDQKKTGWRIYRPRYKQKDCIGDRACELCCPDGAVYQEGKRKFQVDLDACKGCGVCAEMCPVNDIEMVLEEGGSHVERMEQAPSQIDEQTGSRSGEADR